MGKTQKSMLVKMFMNSSRSAIEEEINEWIGDREMMWSKIEYQFEIIDIKYSATIDGDFLWHNCMVVYKI